MWLHGYSFSDISEKAKSHSNLPVPLAKRFCPLLNNSVFFTYFPFKTKSTHIFLYLGEDRLFFETLFLKRRRLQMKLALWYFFLWPGNVSQNFLWSLNLTTCTISIKVFQEIGQQMRTPIKTGEYLHCIFRCKNRCKDFGHCDELGAYGKH